MVTILDQSSTRAWNVKTPTTLSSQSYLAVKFLTKIPRAKSSQTVQMLFHPIPCFKELVMMSAFDIEGFYTKSNCVELSMKYVNSQFNTF